MDDLSEPTVACAISVPAATSRATPSALERKSGAIDAPLSGDHMALARNLVQQYHAKRAANPSQFPSRAKTRPRSVAGYSATTSKRHRADSEGSPSPTSSQHPSPQPSRGPTLEPRSPSTNADHPASPAPSAQAPASVSPSRRVCMPSGLAESPCPSPPVCPALNAVPAPSSSQAPVATQVPSSSTPAAPAQRGTPAAQLRSDSPLRCVSPCWDAAGPCSVVHQAPEAPGRAASASPHPTPFHPSHLRPAGTCPAAPPALAPAQPEPAARGVKSGSLAARLSPAPPAPVTQLLSAVPPDMPDEVPPTADKREAVTANIMHDLHAPCRPSGSGSMGGAETARCEGAGGGVSPGQHSEAAAVRSCSLPAGSAADDGGRGGSCEGSDTERPSLASKSAGRGCNVPVEHHVQQGCAVAAKTEPQACACQVAAVEGPTHRPAVARRPGASSMQPRRRAGAGRRCGEGATEPTASDQYTCMQGGSDVTPPATAGTSPKETLGQSTSIGPSALQRKACRPAALAAAAAATAAMYNPNYPYPPRPPHAPGFAPVRAPIGSLWRPAIQCGPPLVLPEGYEEETEPVPEEEVPAPPQPPQEVYATPPGRSVCRWVHGSAAALAAARQAADQEAGSAAKAAKAAAEAAAAEEADDEDAVATKAFVPAPPDSRRRRMPSAVVRAARATAAAFAVPSEPPPPVAAAADSAGASFSVGAAAAVAAASGMAADDDMAGREVAEVDLAPGSFLVRLQWRHTGSNVGVASDGDVLVARCTSAEVAQASLVSTQEMLRARVVPGDLPRLRQAWRIEHSAADHFVAESRCTREVWYVLWQPLPTALHELQHRPVTYQESPWAVLHMHQHAYQRMPCGGPTDAVGPLPCP